MIYALLIYIAAVVTYLAIIKNLKAEEPKTKQQKSRTLLSKNSYTSPLKTYKEYDQFKDKKSKLYAPITPKGRGVEIKKKEE